MPGTEIHGKEWDEGAPPLANDHGRTPQDLEPAPRNFTLETPGWLSPCDCNPLEKYIDLSYGEALELLALKGLTADKLDHLITILKETLAFDSPFGDMDEQTEAASARDNQQLKNMSRAGIAGEFPDFPNRTCGT